MLLINLPRRSSSQIERWGTSYKEILCGSDHLPSFTCAVRPNNHFDVRYLFQLNELYYKCKLFLIYLLFVTNIVHILCNLLNVSPDFALFADFTSPSASSLSAFLNSIIESRKSFRTSPWFSLEQSNKH
jgi:hypothetical protein